MSTTTATAEPVCRCTVRDPVSKKLRRCKKQGDPLCFKHTDSSPCYFEGCENFGPVVKKGEIVTHQSFCWLHQPSSQSINIKDHGNCLDMVVYQDDGAHLSTTFMMEDVCIRPACMNPEESGGFCREHCHQHRPEIINQCLAVIGGLTNHIKQGEIRARQFDELDKRKEALMSASVMEEMDATLLEGLSDSAPELLQQLRSRYTSGNT